MFEPVERFISKNNEARAKDESEGVDILHGRGSSFEWRIRTRGGRGDDCGDSGVNREAMQEIFAYRLREKDTCQHLEKSCGAITVARDSPFRSLDGTDVHAAIR